jgi:hypothetical protein
MLCLYPVVKFQRIIHIMNMHMNRTGMGVLAVAM